jgi:alkanesulfonate monooxygenase SsuD/methylene tetrahydromethanopterin reductase-like flavin-dependent oxidoreductase (luciferase family)
MDIGAVMSWSGSLGSEYEETIPIAERLRQLAVTAEKAGVTYLWTQEHHMIHTLQSPSALIAAAHIGQHVSVKVGTAVVVLPYHDAIQIAGDIAQTDNVLGGRLQLGVARGAYGYEFEKFHIPFEKSRDKFIETLDAVKLLLEQEDKESSFHGEFVNFDDVYIWPRPIQKPTPPIWLGAQSPAAIEDAAARGYNVLTALFLWDDDHLANLVEAFHQGQKRGGHADTKFCASRYLYVATDEADADARVDELLAHWRVHQQLHDFSHGDNPRGIIPPRPQENEPTREQIRDTLLIGTADHVTAKLDRYEEIGVDLINLQLNYGPRHEHVMASLGRLGEILDARKAKTEAVSA